jgi:hypothetical protein
MTRLEGCEGSQLRVVLDSWRVCYGREGVLSSLVLHTHEIALRMNASFHRLAGQGFLKRRRRAAPLAAAHAPRAIKADGGGGALHAIRVRCAYVYVCVCIWRLSELAYFGAVARGEPAEEVLSS